MNNNRLPMLDLLRGVAVVMVFYFHASTSTMLERLGVWERVLTWPGTFMWSGVDLFFVLSGFLITRVLLNSRDSKAFYLDFYIKRFFRIFPLYYGYLALVFFGIPKLTGSTLPGLDQMHYFLFLQNWLPHGKIFNLLPLDHMWSLSVEEQFYLVWPFLVKTLELKWLRRTCLGSIVLCPLLRLAFLHSVGWEVLYTNSILRSDTLLSGALIAVLLQENKLDSVKPFYRWGAILGMALVCGNYGMGANASFTSAFTRTLGYSGFALIYSSLIVHSFQRSVTEGKTRLGNFFTQMGKHSYAFYIFHMPVILILRGIFFSDPEISGPEFMFGRIVYFLTAFLISYAVSRVVWTLIEKPAAHIRNWILENKL